MNTARRLAALCLGLSAMSLAACDAANAPQPSPPIEDDAGAVATATPTSDEEPSSETPPPGYTDGSGVNEGYPDLTPAPLEGEAERGEKGARNVLQSFVRALELKEFDQAYGLMRGQARDSTSGADLTEQFADFGTISVSAPGGQLEGAAGTTYYSAPITITGSNGQELTGEIVLSRVNDVPGASADQLRWHIRQFDVEPG
ncbi:hypothetical protein AAG607_05130 [Citromicrobium bathyomarinum]|uniref:hypothetical protein n=1 Tax=Sphingomonadales TaxID=204457 RepID=UPI0026D14450|tara:strand:- start:32 stop:634 length:603 start_codon:yes stop_codon:yes gene_type:complete